MSVTDPVCGLEFDESLAIVHEYNDKKYYPFITPPSANKHLLFLSSTPRSKWA